LLAQFVAAEKTLTAQEHGFAVFLPKFSATLKSLGPVVTRYRLAVSAAKSSTTQAAALDTYAHGLERPLAVLRKLEPPPVLRPSYTTQVETLSGSRSTGLALATALRKGQEARASTLAKRLARINVSGSSLAAQRAQIAAVKSYDAEVDRVGTLNNRVQREVLRLQKTLH
jgi:hypothetical protein